MDNVLGLVKLRQWEPVLGLLLQGMGGRTGGVGCRTAGAVWGQKCGYLLWSHAHLPCSHRHWPCSHRR